ncbi:hypothetical protein DR864_21480 [Runella rosea]|uniref:Uncharacterized protein n=1 Tax=Runella rosea TaxID=2259595 RepID=A0A344TNB5_9BACT|nr:hypothetical protein DR864_21480 [Runella rosea]
MFFFGFFIFANLLLYQRLFVKQNFAFVLYFYNSGPLNAQLFLLKVAEFQSFWADISNSDNLLAKLTTIKD